MEDLISPKYQMQLVDSVEKAIWNEYKSYKLVSTYINKWHKEDRLSAFEYWENFLIVKKPNNDIDLTSTLHGMTGDLLLKIAIDLDVDTPDFIPSIPTFKNELKSDYTTAYKTFTKAYKQVDSDPSLAVGLANSALESIIKEILKDDRISQKIKGHETLYDLTLVILKEFKLTNKENPKEIKTIGTSIATINQAIEDLRSKKTDFHGKTNDDFIINDKIYAHFVVNSVAAVGLFLNSYYKEKFPKPTPIEKEDDLPF